jgi:hypothetical protein
MKRMTEWDLWEYFSSYETKRHRVGTWRPCPTFPGSPPPTTSSAGAMRTFAKPWAISFPSTSTTPSFASARSWRTARPIAGPWTRWARRTVGERSEKQLIRSFCEKIAELTPQLVTFNGNSFDLPVLR